jgi:hypothetical protein
LTTSARRVADEQLLECLRAHPTAGVCELAALLGVGHPSVSRRTTRLKTIGRVDRVEGRWVVEARYVPKTIWIKHVNTFLRRRLTTWGEPVENQGNSREPAAAPHPKYGARHGSLALR